MRLDQSKFHLSFTPEVQTILYGYLHFEGDVGQCQRVSIYVLITIYVFNYR